MTSPPSKRDKDRKGSDEGLIFIKHAGKWLVISTASPLFCFEADTPEEAAGLAGRAFDLCEKVKAKPKSPRQIYNEAIESVWTESGKAE